MSTLDHINRYVADIDRSAAFYRDALGYMILDVGVKASGFRYVILAGRGHELFLSEGPHVAGDHGRVRHVGYAVADVGAHLSRLKDLGYAGPEAEVIGKPYSLQAYIHDPDGLEIDLIQWTDKAGFYRDLAARSRGAAGPGDPLSEREE